jgi:hypothetical protein
MSKEKIEAVENEEIIENEVIENDIAIEDNRENEEIIEKPIDNKNNKVIFKSDEEKEFYDSLTESEQLAWGAGWKKGKYFRGLNKDGTPRKELTAEEFLQNMKLSKTGSERLGKLSRDTVEKDKTILELKKQVQELLKFTKQKNENEILSRKQSLEQEEEDAILSGDLEKVKHIRNLQKKIEENKFNFSTEEEPKTQQPVQNNVSTLPPEILAERQRIVNEFKSIHTWYNDDAELQGYADVVFRKLDNDVNYRHLSFQDKLDMVVERVEKKFPDEIGIKKPLTVASGRRGISSPTKQITINDLPDDAKKAYNYFASKEKTEEGKKKIRDFYIKEYSNQK